MGHKFRGAGSFLTLTIAAAAMALVVATLAGGVASAGEETITGDAAKGKAVYLQYCAACHGESGKGDGPAGAALNPKPRNFNDPESMGKLTDAQVLQGHQRKAAPPSASRRS
ncbi:MAG: c-type cytochrome [Deltaproteobacteria bacterium]|nr:c-type cytochrome [Deltaproteobacteria bacterium]